MTSVNDLRNTIQGIVEIATENPELTKRFLEINESIKKTCSSLQSLGFPPTQYFIKRTCIVRNDIELIYNDLVKMQLV